MSVSMEEEVEVIKMVEFREWTFQKVYFETIEEQWGTVKKADG